MKKYHNLTTILPGGADVPLGLYKGQRMYKEKAKRNNKDKLKWSLVDFNSFEDMVKALEYGAKKYDMHNWKKGLLITEVADSMLRHLFSFLEGEDNDKESGISHIGHIQANAMFLSYMIKNKKNFDDRKVLCSENIK